MGWWKEGLAILAWSFLVVVVPQRAPDKSVVYECNKTSIHLTVAMPSWGTRLRLDPQFLRLGTCPPSSENYHRGIFLFQYSLKECGFARLTSGKKVEHLVDLVYRPPSPPHRGRFYSYYPFTERINCTGVKSEQLPPEQMSVAMGQLFASSGLLYVATLMNEDFSAPSNTNIFFLGSQINIEFAVQLSSHQPLRLFVDECLAATTSDLSKSLRNHSIVANKGCVVDGKIANSRFLPREAPERIHLSLQAFEFVGVNTDIYLHCRLLVWDPKVFADPIRKACSFRRDTQRWELLDNSSLSAVCNCCDSVCQATGSRPRRDLEAQSSPRYNTVIGHLKIQQPAQDAGNYRWVSNSSFAAKSHKGGKQNAMSPVVGALLLELAVVAALSLGFCFYNGYQKRLCLWSRRSGSLDTQGLLNAQQDCGSINADIQNRPYTT